MKLPMDDFTLARVVHLVAVLLWIGGVAFVTMVIMPAIRKNETAERRLIAFHAIEDGFAWQARIWVTLAGASGFWMVWRGEMWWRFAESASWWMAAMLIIWVLFTMMLFVIEPLFLHRRMKESPTPEADFQRMELVHRILLTASLITFIGAAGGAHGLW